MSTTPLVVRHPTPELLASAVGARLVTTLLDVGAAGRPPHVVLTGGSMGSAVLRGARDCAAREAVDWSAPSWWWGDERFLPGGDPERNDTQSRAALLDHVPVSPERVHAVAGPGGPHGASAEESAADYARQLGEAAAPGETSPVFDVLMLGVGPDGHIASLFPGHRALMLDDVAAAVHGSPKPPPTRVTLTLTALRRAREVWFVVSGADKAQAVARALVGDDVQRTPAGHVAGLERTLWLLDEAAASAL